MIKYVGEIKNRIMNFNLEKTYTNDFSILREYGNLVDEWSNVYDHCKKEGELAFIIGKLLKLSEDDLSTLVRGAILHDWFKRSEREVAEMYGGDPEKYDTANEFSYSGLIELNVPERVVEVAHSVGHTALKKIQLSSDILKRTMFLIDNIVDGDTLVEYDERMDRLEKSSRYTKLNEAGRAEHNGRTYYEV
jgi:hypothetical protein